MASLFKGIAGVIAFGVGSFLSLAFGAVAFGSSVGAITTNMLGQYLGFLTPIYAVVAGLGVIGTIGSLVLAWWGLKTASENEVKVIRYAVGAVGLYVVVASGILAIALVETIVGAIAFAMLALVGLVLMDYGFNVSALPVVKELFQNVLYPVLMPIRGGMEAVGVRVH